MVKKYHSVPIKVILLCIKSLALSTVLNPSLLSAIEHESVVINPSKSNKKHGAPSSRITISSIKITVDDIYELNPTDSEKDTVWFQEFANTYHMKTKEQVVINLLSLKIGDSVTGEDLREAERLLRQQSYLRDAEVNLSNDGVLNVRVIDNWTLFPTVSFTRTGRQNSSSFGLRDANLLGLGIATTLSYKRDEQKTGYRMRFRSPTSFIAEHSHTSVILENYDVGQQKAFIFNKPFYATDTINMFFTSLFTSNLESLFDHNGEQVGVAETDVNAVNIVYGVLDKQKGETTYRSMVGVSSYSNDLIRYDSLATADFFNLRKQDYIWYGKERFESRYAVLQNIYIMSNKEDINLGLIDNWKIGLGTTTINQVLDESLAETSQDSIFVKLIYDLQFGQSFDDIFVLQRLNLISDVFKNDELDDYSSLNYKIEFFYPFSPKYTLYNSTNISYVSDFRNVPHAIGGETGLRGYPTQYQYGKKRWITSFELRYYSDYTLWDTFTFGLAGFIDIGRAWDNPATANIEDSTLAGIGFGMRIFPKISSGRHVFHIDLARPFSDNPEIDNWEWRIQLKNSF